MGHVGTVNDYTSAVARDNCAPAVGSGVCNISCTLPSRPSLPAGGTTYMLIEHIMSSGRVGLGVTEALQELDQDCRQ